MGYLKEMSTVNLDASINETLKVDERLIIVETEKKIIFDRRSISSKSGIIEFMETDH